MAAPPRSHILETRDGPTRHVAGAMLSSVAVANSDDILHSLADRVADEGVGMLPLVERQDPTRLRDLIITRFDLLQARQRLLEDERHAERTLTLRRPAAASLPIHDQDPPGAP